ncbi:MAG TPA: GNAT family N-acetyltransferase [Gaiellales bacterium]|nr:GNAT family N-acetyltransferase [Gaiellales bacterium]
MPDANTRDEAAAVYRAAFGQKPYDEDEAAAEAFAERVERYARTRDGFRFAAARTDEGRVQGFGLAVLARPGDPWRDAAAASLTSELVRRRIGDECLEVVHIAVAPSAQGHGVGRLVHDVLLAGRPAPTAILSVHPDAPAAQGLYRSAGWQVLTRSLPTVAGSFWLMGRDL